MMVYGSMRLNVLGPGSDIDVVCVDMLQNGVTHDDFFDGACDADVFSCSVMCRFVCTRVVAGSLEQALTNDARVSTIRSVPDAFVPVLKMVFDGTVCPSANLRS